MSRDDGFDIIFAQRTTGEQHPLHGKSLIEEEKLARTDMQVRLYKEFAAKPHGKGSELNFANVRQVIKEFSADYRKKGIPLPSDINVWGPPEKLKRIAELLIKRPPEEVEGVVEWFPVRGQKRKHADHASFLKNRREKRRKAAREKKERMRKEQEAMAAMRRDHNT